MVETDPSKPNGVPYLRAQLEVLDLKYIASRAYFRPKLHIKISCLLWKVVPLVKPCCCPLVVKSSKNKIVTLNYYQNWEDMWSLDNIWAGTDI